MPTLETGNRHPDKGLSLLELLVTLLVISLVGMVIVMSLPQPQEDGEKIATQLLVKVQSAKDMAITRGETIGFSATANRYAFYRYQTDGWETIDDTASLSAKELPSTILLVIMPSNEAPTGTVGQLSNVSRSSDSETGTPKIIFLPTGDGTQFTLTVSAGLKSWKLTFADEPHQKLERLQ